MKTIGQYVRKAEQDYITGNTIISKYVSQSQFENLNIIDAYLNSKHTSGLTDSKGREKPFFNIVTSAVNIWFRATDIDRKDIKIHPSKSTETLGAFLATCHLQYWMRKENFGAFLNDWGRTLSRYGSAVIKFVDTGTELHKMVIPWNRLITDTVDFDSSPVIEKLYLTAAQLKARKGYKPAMVKKLLDALQARKDLDRQRKDNRNEFIEIYEIHGVLPLSFLTGRTKDEDTYIQQMQVLSFQAVDNNGEDWEDYVLMSGREKQSPYMITDLIKEDGQTLSIGAVQNLFEAQWMTNHSVKAIKDQLDVASKLVFQTSDGNFIGQNALNSIENGDILIHAIGMPLTQMQNNSHDITSLQSFAQQWEALGNQINGISDAMLGITPPSGTAWRQTQSLLQESHSLFEIMTENKGLAVEQMMRLFIIPFINRTQMSTSKEIAATLDSYGITKVDSMYVPSEAARRANNANIDAVLSGKMAQNFDPQQMQAQVQNELNQNGNVRFFKPSDDPDSVWSDVFQDLEWDVEVEVTGEDKDRQAMMDTLNTMFQTIVKNPQALSDPNAKLIFNKILDLTAAVSPLELSQVPPTPVAPPKPNVAQAINFKDLPADGQVQMASEVGIKIAPPAPTVPSIATPQQPVSIAQPTQ